MQIDKVIEVHTVLYLYDGFDGKFLECPSELCIVNLVQICVAALKMNTYMYMTDTNTSVVLLTYLFDTTLDQFGKEQRKRRRVWSLNWIKCSWISYNTLFGFRSLGTPAAHWTSKAHASPSTSYFYTRGSSECAFKYRGIPCRIHWDTTRIIWRGGRISRLQTARIMQSENLSTIHSLIKQHPLKNSIK